MQPSVDIVDNSYYLVAAAELCCTTGLLLLGGLLTRAADDPSASQSVFTITEKASNRASRRFQPVGAFSVIVQPVVKPMDRFTALGLCHGERRRVGVKINGQVPTR